MLTELSSFLNRAGDKDLLGQSVVITDSEVNGEFLVHHFIAQALKDGHITVLVSFAQSFIHYSSIATKLGVSLARQEELGNFIYVDCLTNLLAQQGEGCGMGGVNKQVKDHTRPSFSLDCNLSIQDLYKLLRKCLLEVCSQKPGKPVCLVLDDLSVLVGVGVKLVEVVGLVHYCRQMVASSSGPHQGSGGYMVTMVHCESGEGDEDLLARHLLHSSQLSLHVEGLPSGYSRDVHGQLTVTWRDKRNFTPTSSTKKEAQFKLSDRTVSLFAKGTSSAVL